MEVSNKFTKVTQTQLDGVLGALSTYFGGLIGFSYCPEEGVKAAIPQDLQKPELFESTCDRVIQNVLGDDRPSLGRLRL